MTPYDYPEDEFDTREDGRVPVGVHRAPTPSWRGWLPLLLVIVLVPILAWGAVTLLSHTGKSSDSGSSSATPSAQTSASAEAEATQEASIPAEDDQPTAEATEAATPEATEAPAASADMTTGITIHNGAGTQGLATRTGDRLTNAGYTNVQVQPGVYEQSSPTATTIYYASAEQEATARAIGASLGITAIELSPQEAQSNPIVIVLRSDFKE